MVRRVVFPSLVIMSLLLGGMAMAATVNGRDLLHGGGIKLVQYADEEQNQGDSQDKNSNEANHKPHDCCGEKED